MKWKLTIKNFGKIKEAEIHDSSLRFIVGPNNSGKSYLMTLLWEMGNFTHYAGLSKDEIDLSPWIDAEKYRKIFSGVPCEFLFGDYADIISHYINLILQKKKDEIVSKLFQFDNMKIEELSLSLNFDINEKFTIYNDGKTSVFIITVNSIEQHVIMIPGDMLSLLDSVVSVLLDSIFIGKNSNNGKAVYLPAARTGFMLTKDIINKVGRRIAFANEENKHEPFTMPIIEFLEVMEDLNHDIKSDNQYEEICDLIEDMLLQGNLYVSDTPNKALAFIPAGTAEILPLRTTSAVVTEISPLYLLLKNHMRSFDISSIYYEEPEMCLHPQLQQVVARVLIQLANTGINMTATTHSDIILQHVNNMIRLNSSQNTELMERFHYEEKDLLNNLDISMYQFRENEDGTTSLEELKCGDYGFEVPTFNNALDNLLAEVYALQEEET